MFFRITLIILFAITIACSKEDPEYKLNPKVNAYEVYKEAYEAFEKQDYFFAQKNVREYFGPTNIKKLKISLLDQFGRIFELNNSDWSFIATFECLQSN